ncbi:MAG TPA: hypothetical protein VGM44_20115 [Polyangiaceae bacterium]
MFEPEHVAFAFMHAVPDPEPAWPEPPLPLAPPPLLPPLLVPALLDVPPAPLAPPLVPLEPALAPLLLVVPPALDVAPALLEALPPLLELLPPLALLVPAWPPVATAFVVPAPELVWLDPSELEQPAPMSKAAGRRETAESTWNGRRRGNEFMALSG